MSVVEQFPYRDRNPASGGLDLMPDLPIVLRHQSHSLSGVGLVDSGASISVLPYSLGVQLGFDWNTQQAPITLAGTLAHVAARGIVVEVAVGQLPSVRLALAWADSDQVPFLFGQFNFFQAFDGRPNHRAVRLVHRIHVRQDKAASSGTGDVGQPLRHETRQPVPRRQV